MFQFEVLEYSGVKEDKDICGLGVLNEKSKTLEPDAILTWEKPENWSHEEVAAVLLPYSMVGCMSLNRGANTQFHFKVISKNTDTIQKLRINITV